MHYAVSKMKNNNILNAKVFMRPTPMNFKLYHGYLSTHGGRLYKYNENFFSI